MSDASGTAGAKCPKCGAANVLAARFCASCGAALGPDAAPPPPPPPPRYGGGGGGGFAGSAGWSASGPVGAGGFDGQGVIVAGQSESYNRVVAAIVQIGGEVHAGQAPSALEGVITTKNFYYTLATNVRYRVSAIISDQGPDRSLVQMRLSPEWGSAVPMFLGSAALGVCGFILGVANGGTGMLLAVLFGFGSAIGGAYGISSPMKAALAKKIIGAAGGGPVFGDAPGASEPDLRRAAPRDPPSSGRSSPGPTKPTSTGAAAGASAEDLSPLERLERIKKLRDAGALTSQEYDAKRAEILKHL